MSALRLTLGPCGDGGEDKDKVRGRDKDFRILRLWQSVRDPPLAVKLLAGALLMCMAWGACRHQRTVGVSPLVMPMGPVEPMGLGPDRTAKHEELSGLATARWLMESLVVVGPVRMGLPGLCVICLMLSPALETMPRIRRDGDVGRLPLLPLSAMATTSLIWLCYGLLGRNPALVCPNAAGLALGLHYWAVYLRHCAPGADWLPSTREVHFVVAGCTAAFCVAACLLLGTPLAMMALGVAGNCWNIGLSGGPLTAIRTVLAEKSTASLPFGFTCVCFANTCLWTFYGVVIMGDPQIYASNMVGMLLTSSQLALFATFGVQTATPEAGDARDVDKGEQ